MPNVNRLLKVGRFKLCRQHRCSERSCSVQGVREHCRPRLSRHLLLLPGQLERHLWSEMVVVRLFLFLHVPHQRPNAKLSLHVLAQGVFTVLSQSTRGSVRRLHHLQYGHRILHHRHFHPGTENIQARLSLLCRESWGSPGHKDRSLPVGGRRLFVCVWDQFGGERPHASYSSYQTGNVQVEAGGGGGGEGAANQEKKCPEPWPYQGGSTFIRESSQGLIHIISYVI